MAVFKCKMCGGALEINNNESVATCEYCGTQQTLPRLNDEKRSQMYDRANHFRRNNEFDKAMGIYEQILNEDNTDAEAYWSLVLCRYGIEYVEDPASRKRVPTVNRAQFTSIFDDDNYKSALQYADGYQKSIYEQEAKAINEIQKGILAISSQEEPFDVFICYKETDNSGRRTPDSVLATELYHELAREGFKVFFSRITLEDKLGTAYEPYIFAALNSAKVMVVLGTKPEYFNAVWVKNEWSRYLSLIKSGTNKVLIPAYKDMDPYDLPEEFSHLQAQDMSKLGFMQDLIRGIKKIVGSNTSDVKETVVAYERDTTAFIKRAFLCLEDKEWDNADKYAENALNIDPENADAYLIKLLARLKISDKSKLDQSQIIFDTDSNYQKLLRFTDEQTKEELIIAAMKVREKREEEIYNQADEIFLKAETVADVEKAQALYNSIPDYKHAKRMISRCISKIEEIEEEAKAKIKRKKFLKVSLIVAPIIVAFIIVYATVLVPLIKYNNAVNDYNNDNYHSACIAFYELENYQDSSSLFDKSLYAYVGQCVDNGWGFDLEEYVKKRHYEKIYAKVENAFNKKSTGGDYGFIENYYIVKDILSVLPSNYENTSEMIRLCEIMENSEWTDGGEEIIDAFAKLFEYEGPRDFIINRSLRDDYLESKWVYGTFYFTFSLDKEGRLNSSYNLPRSGVSAAYYDIVDFEYRLYDDNDNEITTYFKFTPKTKNIMEVYCYSNGQTYTLTRS